MNGGHLSRRMIVAIYLTTFSQIVPVNPVGSVFRISQQMPDADRRRKEDKAKKRLASFSAILGDAICLRGLENIAYEGDISGSRFDSHA